MICALADKPVRLNLAFGAEGNQSPSMPPWRVEVPHFLLQSECMSASCQSCAPILPARLEMTSGAYAGTHRVGVSQAGGPPLPSKRAVYPINETGPMALRFLQRVGHSRSE